MRDFVDLQHGIIAAPSSLRRPLGSAAASLPYHAIAPATCIKHEPVRVRCVRALKSASRRAILKAVRNGGASIDFQKTVESIFLLPESPIDAHSIT